MDIGQINSFIKSPLKIQIPCHSQAVELSIKMVTESAKSVYGADSRDGFVKARNYLQPLTARKILIFKRTKRIVTLFLILLDLVIQIEFFFIKLSKIWVKISFALKILCIKKSFLQHICIINTKLNLLVIYFIFSEQFKELIR